MTTRLSIEKEEINLLPAMDFDGEIVEIVTPEGARKAVQVLEHEKVLVFDQDGSVAKTIEPSFESFGVIPEEQ